MTAHVVGVGATIAALYLLVYADLHRAVTWSLAVGLACSLFFMFYVIVTDDTRESEAFRAKTSKKRSLRSIVRAAATLPADAHAIIAPSIDALGGVFSGGSTEVEMKAGSYPDLTERAFNKLVVEYTYASAFLCRLQVHSPKTAARLLAMLRGGEPHGADVGKRGRRRRHRRG